jgi:hypothetical protein
MSTTCAEIHDILTAQGSPSDVIQRLQTDRCASPTHRRASGKFLNLDVAFHSGGYAPDHTAGLMGDVCVGSMAIAVEQSHVEKACAALSRYFKAPSTARHSRNKQTNQSDKYTQQTQVSAAGHRDDNHQAQEVHAHDSSSVQVQSCDPTELLPGGMHFTVQMNLFTIAIGGANATWTRATIDGVHVCLDSRHSATNYFCFELGYSAVHVSQCGSGTTKLLGPAVQSPDSEPEEYQMIRLVLERGNEEEPPMCGLDLAEGRALPRARALDIAAVCTAAAHGMLADRVYMFRYAQTLSTSQACRCMLGPSHFDDLGYDSHRHVPKA